MITAVEIENLRGIRQGRHDGLTALTVLTGVNGSGKSTVLDALLLGANRSPGRALVQRLPERRPTLRNPGAWLVSGKGATLRVELDHGASEHTLQLTREDQTTTLAAPDGSGRATLNDQGGGGFSDPVFDELLPEVGIIDPGQPEDLQAAYAAAARQGTRGHVLELLRELMPGVVSLESLLEERGQTQLYATFADGALPVALAGDGLQAFLQIALGVAAVPAGLALVEEPEVFQHPGSLTRTAQVLWAGVHRGVQVVVTTHSLELIDRILASAGEGDLDQLTVFNLALDDGELRASRFEGVDLPQVRGELESDLR